MCWVPAPFQPACTQITVLHKCAVVRFTHQDKSLQPSSKLAGTAAHASVQTLFICFSVSQLSQKQWVITKTFLHKKEIKCFLFDMNCRHWIRVINKKKNQQKLTKFKSWNFISFLLFASTSRFHRHSGYQARPSPHPGANSWTDACGKQLLHLRRLQLCHHHRA